MMIIAIVCIAIYAAFVAFHVIETFSLAVDLHNLTIKPEHANGK